jgi:hypothetical protein
MKDFKQDYQRYNSTVKTVQDACMAMNNDYHMADGDIKALAYAISDLSHILEHYSSKLTEVN